MARIIKRFYPVIFPVDGEDTALRIMRLSGDQYRAFENDFFRYGRHSSRRVEKLKKTDDEQVAEQIFDEASRENEEAFAFYADAIGRYVTAEAGQIYDEDVDGKQVSVTEGADLLRLYGAKKGFVGDMLALIYGENRLEEKEKNAYRSLLGSGSTSPDSAARTPTADGPSPAATATPAEPEGMTSSEGATAPSTPTTDGLSSTPDPS